MYHIHVNNNIIPCRYHGDAVGLLKACFGAVSPPSSLTAYMDAVYRLGYTDQPDYSKLKDLFTKELKALGCRGDGKDSLDWITSGKVCFPNKYLVKITHLLFVSEQILLLSPLTTAEGKSC